MSAKLELNRIEVATPCPARWEDMTGDERSRFCQHCQKHVYNLSAMTRGEAEQLIVEKEGNLCARMYRRKDGTILTADCSVGQKMTWGQRRKKVLAAVAGVVLFVGSVLAAKISKGESDEESEVMEQIKEGVGDFAAWLGVDRWLPGRTMGKVCVTIGPVPASSVPPSLTGTTNAQPVQPSVVQTGTGQQP